MNEVNKNEYGFGIVEMIVVIAVILTALVSILQFSVVGRQTQNLAQETGAAAVLAREALEAVRSERDDNWTNISSLTFGTRYYPDLVGSSWVLAVSNPGPIDIYTRWVEFAEVRRDDTTDGIVLSGGSPDPDTRHVTAYVEWTKQGGSTGSLQIETYITNWQGHL